MSGGRDVFPREPDRRVIRAFLAGKSKNLPMEEDSVLTSLGGSLGLVSGGGTVAWYAPDGSLQGKLSMGSSTAYSMTAINWIMGELGAGPDQRVVRELTPPLTDGSLIAPPTAVRFFFAGTLIAPDQPMTLAGPLGVLAYRSSVAVEQGPAFREYP